MNVRLGRSLRRASFVVERASGERRELHVDARGRGQAIATSPSFSRTPALAGGRSRAPAGM